MNIICNFFVIVFEIFFGIFLEDLFGGFFLEEFFGQIFWRIFLEDFLEVIWDISDFKVYTQSPIIRNSPIRLGVEFWGKFKKRALGRSNLRNT